MDTESTNQKRMEKKLSERVNEYIRQNAHKKPKVLAKEISESITPITTNAVDLRIRRMKEVGDLFTQELKDNGFDGEWSHGWLKTQTSSIFIKNDKGFMSYMDIRDDLIGEMRAASPKYPKIKRVKDKTQRLFVPDPADVHFGKLALVDETGSRYDLETAKKRFSEGVDGLIAKVKPFNIGYIVLVLGNDILHIDTTKRTTTAGTPQDTDGMWWQAYQIAKQCYIDAILRLVQIADVKLVFCPSNHDFMSGFMLADSVASWFHNHPNVTDYITMRHRKYIQFGANMIGFTHGDGARNADLPNLMMTETRGEDFRFGYWIIHHGHYKNRFMKRAGQKGIDQVEVDKHLITEINTGLKRQPEREIFVEMVRTPSAPDRWHDTNGYKNIQAMEGFIFDPTGGQIARITHHF